MTDATITATDNGPYMERHAVGLRGVAPDRATSPSSSAARASNPHSHASTLFRTPRGEVPYPRLDRGKIAEANG
jgi:hypothetical protein